MRAYLIDEITSPDMGRIVDFLSRHTLRSGMEDVFWVQIPNDLLSEQQYTHRTCRPHVFAIEVGDDWIKLECFIRSLQGMRCTCADYATRQQQDFIIQFAHTMIQDLGIRT